ncbi:protein MODIFIER OF SNC1 11-like isoform X1 [Zingiber officinale]|uniref:protein MODIFIER OF SNC1 11-like isoform X1 n=1 Tax=Zingiber officinale TaxID=94328 RepID=UPI001C4CBD46|nr:protein MODIFIER OF SNC1 11-like isoform X1 [Zingiber officinale]
MDALRLEPAVEDPSVGVATSVNKLPPPAVPLGNPTFPLRQTEVLGISEEVGEPTAAKLVGPRPTGGSDSAMTNASESNPVTDLEKKLRRAERFGMQVVLSEVEKRNSRAERFGTGSNLSGSKIVGQPEEEKRKARAERFGLKVDDVADEEAKKKARLERFAPNSKLDTSEEEKRKARAIRFSQGSTKVSGQGNSYLKAMVVPPT